MNDTRVTLLLRLRDRADQDAWAEFHQLYAPLLYHFARQRGLSHADAEEIRDQCLLVITRKLPTLDYDRDRGRFKNWLCCIANGKVVDFLRKRREDRADTRVLREATDPQPTPEDVWDRQWRYQHLLHCAAQVKPTFNEQTYHAFELLAFEGCDVDDVCQRLNLTRAQVYTAKSRVLRRIREQIEALGLEL